MEKNTKIYGIRAIIEAIESDESIEKVFLLKGADGVLMNQLKSLVSKRNISSSYVPVEKLDKLVHGNHQGAVAHISPIQYYQLEDILENLNPDETPLFLLLDQVTDVRNYGAMIRTADCTGVTAIIVPEKGAAPINAHTIKTSAGGVFNVPICKVIHIKDAVFLMQAYNIKTVAATEKATNYVYDVDLSTPLAIIMGSEERGITPSILKIADEQVKLPLKGEIGSLNVSVACGALLYETLRQRR